ncbi:MAG: hypothetical protein ACOYOT_03310 [Bacteroidales bacterium]
MKTHILFLLTLLCGQVAAIERDSIQVKQQIPLKIEIGLLGGYNFSGNTYAGDDPFEGVIGGFSVGWERQLLNYKVRFDYGSEIQFMAVKEPNESVSDLSFLVGKEFRDKLASFSCFGGIGLLWSTSRGEYISRESGWFGKSNYRDNSSVNPALSFECNLTYQLFRKCSTGICGFGSITPNDGFFGLMLKVGVTIPEK